MQGFYKNTTPLAKIRDHKMAHDGKKLLDLLGSMPGSEAPGDLGKPCFACAAHKRYAYSRAALSTDV